ncbi:hypothetical protein [Streptomyces sp. NPDC048442]|uniref:hypothetical protein n=1 Tax=Streptomyces sp. NPDC048442 TaxID=3154823 RepID=UPI00341F76A8
MTIDPSATEILTAIARRSRGSAFAAWTIPTRSGHLVGLLAENPVTRWSPWSHQQTIRANTLKVLLDAGLVPLGELEPVPEYEGSRHGLRWAPGRTGRRLTVTNAGRTAAGPELPHTLP